MRLFDFRYKGVRVQKNYSDIFKYYLLTVYSCVTVMLFILTFLRTRIFQGSLEEIALNCIILLLVSGIVSLVLVLLLYPFSRRFIFLQRICRMFYDSQFYIVNNFVDNNMVTSKEGKIKREIIYFPRCYIKVKGNKLVFTIQLDGSKFHQQGSYEKLSGILEQRFDANLADMYEKNSFLTYVFDSNLKANRIGIEDVTVESSKIKLMKNTVWDVEKVPHALIVGGTGGGKSYLLMVLLEAFAKMGADIRIADPKNADLSDYGRVLENVSVDRDNISTMIENVVDDMEKRYEYVKTLPNYRAGHSYAHYELKPIFLIIDEYVAFLSSFSKKGERDSVLNDIRQIILKGRQVGVFGIFATQRPDAKYLEGDIRDQLGLKISVGKLESDGYRMTFGKTDQVLKNKGSMKARGYLDMLVYDFIHGFYSPLVPKDYNFIEAFGKLVGVSAREFVAQAKNSSESEKDDPLSDSEEYVLREQVYEKVNGYERSE